MFEEVDTLLLSENKDTGISPVVFGSNVERLMFPMHSAPTRLGIEQGIRGEPHCGPGSYDQDPLTLFLQPQDKKPKSCKGWYFGCRTSNARQSLDKNSQVPSPAHYQKIEYDQCSPDYQPFGAICPRFSPKQYSTLPPGPGHYDHDVETNRTVDVHCSFGGHRKLKETVTIKCTNGIPEQCSSCQVPHVGDYYELVGNKDRSLCPKCFNILKNANNPMRAKTVRGYHKVRDCSSIHKHEFPGFPPKLILKTEKEQRHLKRKEAYMSCYYSE